MLPDGAGEQIEAERIGALASIDGLNMPSLGGCRVNGVHQLEDVQRQFPRGAVRQIVGDGMCHV
jgi:hypothetical protein